MLNKMQSQNFELNINEIYDKLTIMLLKFLKLKKMQIQF